MNPLSSFLRTICDCKECTGCCLEMPGPRIPVDGRLIADHLNITVEQLEEKLVASPGATCAKYTHAGWVQYQIHTITPARKEDGTCVFLQEDMHCAIHPVSPFGCAYFDSHHSRKDGDDRMYAALVATDTSPEYKELWLRLYNAGRRSPGPKVLRQRLAAIDS